MRRFPFALVAIAGLATAAHAADVAPPVYKAPPAVQAPSWIGWYAGVSGGYGWHDRAAGFSPDDPASATMFPGSVFQPTALDPASYDVSGGFGGFHLGYNWQFNPNWVAGFEADLSLSDIDGTGSSGNLLVGTAPFTANVSEELKWFGTVRARLGYLVNSQLLLYGTGGFAYGRVEQTADYSAAGAVPLTVIVTLPPFGFRCTNGTSCFSGRSSVMETGWTIGAGAEWILWNDVSVKLEYNFIDLGDSSYAIMATGPNPLAPSSTISVTNRLEFHTVRAGLNWRF